MGEIINGLLESQRIKIVLFLIIFVTLFEALGQYFIKISKNKASLNHSINGSIKYLYLGIISYIIVCLLLYNTYNYEGLGHVNLIWSCMSIILAYAVGHCIFMEPFNEYTVLAILFACSAIYFSYLSDI